MGHDKIKMLLEGLMHIVVCRSHIYDSTIFPKRSRHRVCVYNSRLSVSERLARFSVPVLHHGFANSILFFRLFIQFSRNEGTCVWTGIALMGLHFAFFWALRAFVCI